MLTFRWSNSLLPQKSKQRIQSQKTIAPTGSVYLYILLIFYVPFQTTLRIWDCLFYEGVKIVFRVGVTMIKHNEDKFLQCKSFTEIMDLFKEIPKSKEVLNCHQFMQVRGIKRNLLKGPFRGYILCHGRLPPMLYEALCWTPKLKKWQCQISSPVNRYS